MKAYKPLIVVILVTLFASLALQISRGPWRVISWMQDFMGLFLVVFSMFKLFDISGFADGFSMYDIFASRFKAYGLVFPFIELFLGLAYLARLFPIAIYSMTAAIMIFGSIGVIRSLARGLDVHCACLGTVLKVPLSSVAIFEDLGMAVMALIMLLV
ncbi:MAG: hypothetical protein HZB36_08760 [Candidatus Omnitrophica bacterium]|nr:hypothetical protein [Candidatus Omnitrophota bacterium]